MSRQKDLRERIVKNQRRLQKLKEKEASYGLETPVHILTEIEDIETELERLRAELEEIETTGVVFHINQIYPNPATSP